MAGWGAIAGEREEVNTKIRTYIRGDVEGQFQCSDMDGVTVVCQCSR